MIARDRAGAAIAALPPIGLDALTTDAALLTRVDRKYVVPIEATASLLQDLQRSSGAPAALEIDGERELAYRSVYFDTPDLLSYRLAAHGRRRRFKLRTRTYVDTGAAFLEMKTRGARGLTRKERDAYDLDAADRLTAQARGEVAEALRAIGVEPTRADDLDARLQTLYRRTTLLLPGETPSRATVDLDLRWVATDGAGFTLPRFAIVETKSPGQAGAFDRALWRAGHRPQRVSKYATGLAALRSDLPRNRWTRVLSGPFASAHPSRKDTSCAAV
ncbi:polyphosphate polymerase domain-containing protein [Microbacterium sp. NPDC090007]|uniref:polyphosphate polymerase domain-containing protein n=1 Tax=Microbacterium sp. NPDC090007 TaxID=3364204 RepID=UPI003818056F